MESKVLQEMVKKVFNDEKIRKQFISDPRSVMDQYSLTETEKSAVMKTHSMGLVTGNSTQVAAAIDPRTGWS